MRTHSRTSRRSGRRRAARRVRRRVRKAGLVALALAAGTGAALGLPPLVRSLGRAAHATADKHREAVLSDLTAAYKVKQGGGKIELEDARRVARELSARDR